MKSLIMTVLISSLVVGCASGQRSRAWTVGAIAPGAAAGGATGLAAAAGANASLEAIGAASAAGLIAGGIGGYYLGECARADNLGCKVAVLATDSAIGTAVAFGALAVIAVATAPSANYNFGSNPAL